MLAPIPVLLYWVLLTSLSPCHNCEHLFQLWESPPSVCLFVQPTTSLFNAFSLPTMLPLHSAFWSASHTEAQIPAWPSHPHYATGQLLASFSRKRRWEKWEYLIIAFCSFMLFSSSSSLFPLDIFFSFFICLSLETAYVDFYTYACGPAIYFVEIPSNMHVIWTICFIQWSLRSFVCLWAEAVECTWAWEIGMQGE